MNEGVGLGRSMTEQLLVRAPLGIPGVFALILSNQIVNIGATTGFAFSGRAESTGGFVLWQLVGSVFGLAAQVTFAGLVRLFPLQVANAFGIGLAFVSAQMFGSFFFFREPFTPTQWLGTAFIFAGILCISLGR